MSVALVGAGIGAAGAITAAVIQSGAAGRAQDS